LRLFGEKETFSKNPDFRLDCERDVYHFVYDNRYKIKTDSLGGSIWESLPGSIREIREKVRERLNVSDDLVERFLLVLNRGGVIVSASGKEEKPEADPALRKGEPHKDLVTVIVVTYDGEEHIQECFRSIQGQSYGNLEIIAVDNGSRDRSLAMLRKDFSNVKLYSLRRNIHYAGAVNFGLSKAAGRYIFVLNQDVELHENCIYHLCETARKETYAGAVVPMLKFYHLRGFINGIGNHIRNYGWGSDNFIGCVDIGQFAELKEVPSACFGAVLLDRKALEEVGMLDKRYKSYYEDVDWSFRCWMAGWRIVPAVQAVVYHKFGASYKEDAGKLRLVAKNRLRLVLKLFRGRIRFGFLRRYVKEDVKNTLSLLKKKKFPLVFAYAKAYFLLLWDLPFVFLQRRSVMSKKTTGLTERFILEKNPEFFNCCDEDGSPVIDAGKIFEHYRLVFQKNE
jgi:GT2 family glycosyltransferase